MKLYLVWEEYQNDTPSIHDSLFRSKEAAESFAELIREEYREDGLNIWGDYIEGRKEIDWEVDVHVEELELEEGEGGE